MVKNECKSKQSNVLSPFVYKELTLSKCNENPLKTKVSQSDRGGW